MTAETPATEADAEALQEQPAPACVMTFNASDPSGSGGIAGDVATIAAMGAHALPVVTSIVMRDTAEVFDHHAIDADVIAEQARSVLEDVTISAWKVGFLGSTEGVSAVAEILSDYPDVPLVAYMPNLSWVEEDEQQAYLEAFRETGAARRPEVLVGSHQDADRFLLPDWESERSAPARANFAVAGDNKCGAAGPALMVTSVPAARTSSSTTCWLRHKGAITGEKFGAASRPPSSAPATRCRPLAGRLAGQRRSSCTPPSARP